MQTEFKFGKFTVILSILIPLVLFEPFSKMIGQAIQFHEYYWYLIILFVVQYVYRISIKPLFLMICGVPAIVVASKSIALNERGYTIEWSDVQHINLIVSEGRSTSYTINIEVKEPWKYISQIKNPVMKYYRWYMLEYYNPFTVSLSDIEGDYSEIYATIENYYHSYRKQEWAD